MTYSRTLLPLAGLAALVVQASCSGRELKVPVAPTFSSIQSYTIQPKCLQCHTSLATYEGVLKVVTPGDPSRSRFYTTIESGSMPQYSPTLSSEEITAVRDWIQNGAPND